MDTPETPPQQDVGIVVVDHGSRRPAANEMLNEVVAMYRELYRMPIVEPAHMELADPDIAEAFGRCVAQGARHVVVHPYFLSPGRHSRSDIPELTAEAAARHPGITYAVTDPLGVDPGIAAVMHRRIQDTLASAPAGPAL